MEKVMTHAPLSVQIHGWGAAASWRGRIVAYCLLLLLAEASVLALGRVLRGSNHKTKTTVEVK